VVGKIQNLRGLIIKKIAIIGICLLVGAGIGYGVTYAVQISNLQSQIESYKSQVSALQSDVEKYKSEVSALQSQVSGLKSDIESYKSQIADLKSELARLGWTIQLMTDLQEDQTDEQSLVPGYDEGHLARDLEDSLEELGYRVGYLVVFQYGSTLQPLQWEALVKVYYSNTFAVLVDPQTDRIVTRDYDGNNDGIVDTLLNPGVNEVSSRWDTLVATGVGNDGKYLLLEFGDYDEVQLVQYVPPGQPQESTYPEVYAKLKSDLAEDKTDENEYKKDEGPDKPNYDCDDYARDLERALEAKGYRVCIKIIWWFDEKGEEKGHCIVNVHLRYQLISAAGTTVVDTSVAIEPQNKPCTEDVTNIYDGNGNGKIDASIDPSKPKGDTDYGNFKKTGTGNDGKYYIRSYNNFKDIPFPVDQGKPPPNKQP